MYIDTHCHLNFNDYRNDLSTVLSRAKHANVEKIIIPGVDYHTSIRSIELSTKFPNLHPSIGFHPYEADQEPNTSMLIPHLSKGVVAIGECGLDYHLFKNEKADGKIDKQKYLFLSHCFLANLYNLPLIIHCRDAFDDLFTLLDSLSFMPRAVIHCFSGGIQHCIEAQKRNMFLGIDGNCTFSKQLQMIIPSIPLSMILLETDSPNLSPIPYRGKRNEPNRIPIIAKTVAELKNISVEEVMQSTTNNAHTLFQLL